DTDVGSPNRTPVYEVVPAGTALPQGFVKPLPATDSRIQVCRAAGDCVATTNDLNADGVAEVLIANSSAIQVWESDGRGGWRIVGSWSAPPYRRGGEPVDLRNALRNGEARPVTPEWPDLAFGNRRSSLIRHPVDELP
ncbi:MAG: VCBS repeat-containing protein, partial [Brevundimonas sp.]|nr:VCBS repeat-containing protein [Brevundimonas sp.]